MMLLRDIARTSAFAGLVIACGAGGAGSIENADDPAGPFSGFGSPGRSSIDNPGVFIGPGAPGVGGSPDITSPLTGFCNRVHITCPATDEAACVATFQSQWAKLTSDCERVFYYAYMECLFVRASVTCTGNDQAQIGGCGEYSRSQCGGTTGTTGGTGGSGTGGSGGNTGGTGGNDTGGSGGSGGTGGSSTGGTGGSTGGTGGSTGGTGGTGGGTGGTGGTGGSGGRGGRDAGRG
jgi:hypothetical protein